MSKLSDAIPMRGILRKYRLPSVAILSSLALLVATIVPCACLAEEAPLKKQSESSESHPCGSHGDSHESDQKKESHGSDTDCCCSIDSPRALVGSEVFLAKTQIEIVPLPDLLPPGASLGFPASLVGSRGTHSLPRGSPVEGISAITSSSTLSVRLQRWLL